MLRLVCRECGTVVVGRRLIERQLTNDDVWRCPKCHREAKASEMPDGVVGQPCLCCGKATTLMSLWDDRHVHFFCNVVCVADYDDMFKE